MSILEDMEQQALRDALDDEYRAWATYDQVIRDFGTERPRRTPGEAPGVPASSRVA